MADTKTTALMAATSWSSGDLLYLVRDPSGTPVSRKITLDNVLQNLVCSANSSLLKSSTGYSLTGSNASSMIDLAGTWNTTGTPTLIKANVTDTASNAASLLMDLQVGGSSRFSVRKDGAIIGISTGSLLSNDAFWRIGKVSAWFTAYFDTSSSSGRFSVAADSPIAWSANADASSTVDTILRRDASNTLALRNSTNAQALNIYNTYTSGSVYERGFMRWASNVLEIGTEHSGASNRNIALRLAGFNAVVLDSSQATFNIAINMPLAELRSPSNITAQSGYTEMVEMTSPSAPTTNRVRIFAEDNGSGKTRLMARFATGATQQLAIEP